MATSKQLAARKRTGQRQAAQRNPGGKGAKAKRSRIVKPRRRRSHEDQERDKRMREYWQDRQVRHEAELGVVIAQTFQMTRVQSRAS